MPLISSLLPKVALTFPDITFKQGEYFLWSPTEQTVYYQPDATHAAEQLLHEIAHYLLGHRDYDRDITLLGMESAAWQRAETLAAEYDLPLATSIKEDHLDTYRDWLHARSTCPDCTATGFQTARREYSCVACGHTWRVNEARVCALRRYSIATSAS